MDLLGVGAVHYLPAMHDKNSGRTYLRYDDGKCLHYYFYFLDEDLGLC
jgi:hypothetical protein